jgi:hypothetical protein
LNIKQRVSTVQCAGTCAAAADASAETPARTARQPLPGDIIDWYEVWGEPKRFLHLPIVDAKHSRRHLQARLPAALQFVSHHLHRGGRVLIHDLDGAYRPCCAMYMRWS